MTRTITLVGYAVLAASALVLAFIARRRGEATLGDALRLALRWRPARAAILAAWLWLGWHVFVRVDWE